MKNKKENFEKKAINKAFTYIYKELKNMTKKEYLEYLKNNPTALKGKKKNYDLNSLDDKSEIYRWYIKSIYNFIKNSGSF